MQTVQGNVHFVPAGVFDDQIIAVEALHRQALHPDVPADAVLKVDDAVADLQLLDGPEERRALCRRMGFVPAALGEQLVFCDNREPCAGPSLPLPLQFHEASGHFSFGDGVR